MPPLVSEKDVLAFWEKEHIYQKVKKKCAHGKPFYLMDGPPYATGHIHMGTALNKVLKDVAIRSQRMQGRDVFDRPGYDTHGLPIELQVEKEIGSRSKQDIEAYGVEAFIKKCREYATQYIGVMNEEFKNLGVWMDWDNPYITLSDEYIESIWAVLKKAYEKKLLYKGAYPVHVCPRCATAVAFNEIEYGVQKDRAVYVKFPVKNRKNTFLIIWTTTPWTLPANTGVMVHPDISYNEIKTSAGEHWIIAQDLVPQRMQEFEMGYTLVTTWKGADLVGWTYENPVSRHTRIEVKKGYRVVSAPRYVTVSDGTGLVHCAPGHGKEDYDVGHHNGLDIICPVGVDGILGPETGDYAGGKAREIDAQIVGDLTTGGFLVFEHSYSHDYPLCWRCKTPLLMVSLPQWFLNISQIHARLISENEQVNWLPRYAQARMKAWLEGISDWPISRERYWGTPLPIWQCASCDTTEVLGSIDALKKKAKIKQIDLHKPGIDRVSWTCSCGGVMKRVTSVFDVWFDSGASSWAALGYPSEEKGFKRYWPADLNIEGPDQFRGWWNSQLILSTLGFGKKPYKSISVHGLVLDISKRKMSKSVGNVVSPAEIIEKYGRDYLRYYLVKFSRGEDFAYNEKEFSEIHKFFTVLTNLKTFVSQINKESHKIELEDRWILSRYNTVVNDVFRAYNDYKFYAALDAIENFVINDVSRTYVQMIRDRAGEVKPILERMLVGILQLLAPATPFLTESLWQQLTITDKKTEQSIHLSAFPDFKKTECDARLEKQFSILKSAIEAGLAERDKIKIGLKWPLASVEITSIDKLPATFSIITKQQLNVKKVIFKKSETISVNYDTTMTPELEGEGYSREVMRRVQAERKKRGLTKKDTIRLTLVVSKTLLTLLEQHKKAIAAKTGASSIHLLLEGKVQETFNVKTESVGISF